MYRLHFGGCPGELRLFLFIWFHLIFTFLLGCGNLVVWFRCGWLPVTHADGNDGNEKSFPPLPLLRAVKGYEQTQTPLHLLCRVSFVIVSRWFRTYSLYLPRTRRVIIASTISISPLSPFSFSSLNNSPPLFFVCVCKEGETERECGSRCCVEIDV